MNLKNCIFNQTKEHLLSVDVETVESLDRQLSLIDQLPVVEKDKALTLMNSWKEAVIFEINDMGIRVDTRSYDQTYKSLRRRLLTEIYLNKNHYYFNKKEDIGLDDLLQLSLESWSAFYN